MIDYYENYDEINQELQFLSRETIVDTGIQQSLCGISSRTTKASNRIWIGSGDTFHPEIRQFDFHQTDHM